MDINKMMKQVQKLQQDTERIQNELAEKKYTASIQNGLVTAVANGAGDLLEVKLDPKVVSPDDVEMLQDLILLAVRQAVTEGRNAAAKEMGRLTSGLGLPGMGI